MTKKRSGWPKVRKFFNDVHLWGGLISGIVVIAVCLSGTIYTYNTELTEWAASHLYRVDVPADAERIDADQLIAEIASRSGGTVSTVRVFADPTRTYQFAVRKEGEQSRFGTTYFVNPYTGQINGTSEEANQTRTAVFMRDLFSLHRWLLLDRIENPLIGELPNRTLGSYITGAATILFTLGVITGLIIWFPQKLRSWRQGLRIKWQSGWKRLNHDLHNTLAFYSLIFLFLMGITGPQWSFPWYREGLQKTLGTYREAPSGRGDGPREGRGDGPRGERQQRGDRGRQDGQQDGQPVVQTASVSFAQVLSATDGALPYIGDHAVTLSADGGSITARKNRVGFFAPAAADEVRLDPATGRVTEVSIFREKPLNERIAGSIKALHVGNVYGQFTKLLYFFACLVATSLPITGTMIWLNKMKKKPKARRKSRLISGKRPALQARPST